MKKIFITVVAALIAVTSTVSAAYDANGNYYQSNGFDNPNAPVRGTSFGMTLTSVGLALAAAGAAAAIIVTSNTSHGHSH